MIQPDNSILLVCDLQTAFAPVIYGYQHVLNNTNKMLRLAKV